MSSVGLFVLLLASVVAAREPKWFFHRRTLTSYVKEKSLETELIASSCVVVQPSLPPCRHVRQLDIVPSTTESIKSTAPPEQFASYQNWAAMYGPRFIFAESSMEEPLPKETKATSWIEYLGLDDVTVTRTLLQPVTTKQFDPHTVVTFSVKGCHPSKLPFNLPLCDGNSTTNDISIQKDLHYAP